MTPPLHRLPTLPIHLRQVLEVVKQEPGPGNPAKTQPPTRDTAIGLGRCFADELPRRIEGRASQVGVTKGLHVQSLDDIRQSPARGRASGEADGVNGAVQQLEGSGNGTGIDGRRLTDGLGHGRNRGGIRLDLNRGSSDGYQLASGGNADAAVPDQSTDIHPSPCFVGAPTEHPHVSQRSEEALVGV